MDVFCDALCMWLCVRICTLHAFNNFLEGPDDEGEAELTSLHLGFGQVLELEC